MGFFMPGKKKKKKKKSKTREINMPNSRVGEEIADRIAHRIGDGERIRSADISEMIPGDVNCYPSNRKGGCKRVAYFISLKSKRYAIGGGHLTFRKALERLVQHMQGSCPEITEVAILLSDSWDAEVLDDWHNNIETINRQGRIVEAYIIGENSVIRKPI